jgi:hypothetical protein
LNGSGVEKIQKRNKGTKGKLSRGSDVLRKLSMQAKSFVGVADLKIV